VTDRQTDGQKDALKAVAVKSLGARLGLRSAVNSFRRMAAQYVYDAQCVHNS